MGSVGELAKAVVWGEYHQPVITEDTDNGDPWQRAYFVPPTLTPLVPRKYQLHDVRSLIETPGYSATEHLKDQGFGIVRQDSNFLKQLGSGKLFKDAIAELYHPEITKLVKQTTGCKDVFITASVFRQGKRAPEPFSFPTELKRISKDTSVSNDQGEKHNISGQTGLALAAPVRVPHMDFTPLGARRTIRSESKAMYDAALRAGVIAREENIYPEPTTKASDLLIAEQYNANGSLGPRYAAYSIWRPLRKVGRDPITLATRKKGEVTTVGDDLVHHVSTSSRTLVVHVHAVPSQIEPRYPPTLTI